jgi:hypothetical protein
VGAFDFPYSWIFLPPIFLFCFFAVNRDGDIVRESFSVKFILHSLWYTLLVYVFLNLFFQCDLVFVLCFFFSQPDVNITWITGHIHRSIVDKIDPTSEYVEMATTENTLSITLGYIFLWNVIRRIYLPCLQFISKTLLMNRDEDPPFFNLKSGRMANDDICSGKLFTRSVCCFGFKLGIEFNRWFFFLSLKSWKYILFILFVFDNSMKNVIQYTCVDFCENIRS